MKTFTATSMKPYDNHNYKLRFKDGREMIFDDYEILRAAWYQWRKEVDGVDGLDKSGQGF